MEHFHLPKCYMLLYHYCIICLLRIKRFHSFKKYIYIYKHGCGGSVYMCLGVCMQAIYMPHSYGSQKKNVPGGDSLLQHCSPVLILHLYACNSGTSIHWAILMAHNSDFVINKKFKFIVVWKHAFHWFFFWGAGLVWFGLVCVCVFVF